MAVSTEILQETLEQVEAYQRYFKEHKREFVTPEDWYDWQHDAFEAGADHTEVMTLAGNQSGKTASVTYEMALHYTGDYPDWWKGDRFDTGGGIHWVFGVDTTQLKDVIQKALFGEYDSDTRKFKGGGWIKLHEIKNHVPHPNKRGLLADIFVNNKISGVSAVSLRSYTQTETGKGTLSFAGAKVDSVLVDEQPPDDLVGQLAVRRAMGRFGKGGIIRYTMTPELGLTELVRSFMEELKPHQALIGPIGWNDCPHMTPEKQAVLLGSIPVHEQEMRSKGVPFFGSGMVYPVGEDAITCVPFEIPSYFRRLAALDVGIDHPTACAWLAHDTEQDVIYLYGEYKSADMKAAVHVDAIKTRGNIPLVLPHDIDKRDPGTGKELRTYYQGDDKIRTCLDFQNPGGGIRTEPGIMELYQRMTSGRFKVFSTCTEWFKEFRGYHRKDGKIVKVKDDLMDGTRYGVQMIGKHGVNANQMIVRKARVVKRRGPMHGRPAI